MPAEGRVSSLNALAISPTAHLKAAELRFEGVPLFAGLDFELIGGSWTCLLGPSGVGKSSLLRLLAGLIPPTPPTKIEWSPKPPARVSLLAQQDMLLPWLSVLDNALLGPRLRQERDMAAQRDRASALLTRLGLGKVLHQLPDTLSGGMRQRVALARVFVEDAAVILMDEPFSQLDAITRYDLQTLAAQLFAGRTVLLVTHDPLEALRLGHRIVVMAGKPALVSTVELDGATPRDVSAPDIARLHADLMQRLQTAAAVTA
jgi:putative hydroxymethylpyrimidine transport system ATP-binding protein